MVMLKCPRCGKTDTRSSGIRLCDSCYGESQAIPLSFAGVDDASDEFTVDVCTVCGGMDRESVGIHRTPARCSICKMVQPGWRVNQCLRRIKNG